jgi:hypothetical protein
VADRAGTGAEVAHPWPGDDERAERELRDHTRGALEDAVRHRDDEQWNRRGDRDRGIAPQAGRLVRVCALDRRELRLAGRTGVERIGRNVVAGLADRRRDTDR